MLAQNQHQHTNDNSVDQIIRKTIEEVTGNGFNEIRPESDLVEDLGISSGELLNIVKKVQTKLEIELSTDAKHELFDEAQSVQDLVNIFAEEYEF